MTVRHSITFRDGRTQQGFAAIAAIFLVVVLAALGGFMVTMSNTQHLTMAQDMQGTRAYWAARAGLEWGMGRVSAVSDPSTITPSTCSTTLTVDTFSVVVACTVAAYVEAGSGSYLVQLQSVASATGGAVGNLGFIERSISASAVR